MQRRSFVKSVGGATLGIATAGSSSAAECTPPAPSTPQVGENWEVNNEQICESNNYSLYRRTLTNQTLQQRVGEKTNERVNRPVQSLIAIRLTTDGGSMTPPPRKMPECRGSVSVTAFGVGGAIPCSWAEEVGGEDELNPVSPEATRYLETAFRDKINEIHGFSAQYDSQRHLRRAAWAGWRPLEYSKTGYDSFGFTYEPIWENVDDDGFVSDLNFRAYLSVETNGEDYLGVGGVFPDESSQTISVEGNRIGEIEFDKEARQEQTIEFMKNAKLSE